MVLKASTALKRARFHLEKGYALLAPLSEKVAEILEDESAHVFDQSGDGFVVAYRGGQANSILWHEQVDALLKLPKHELLEALDSHSI